jgi:hypothetical protein
MVVLGKIKVIVASVFRPESGPITFAGKAATEHTIIARCRMDFAVTSMSAVSPGFVQGSRPVTASLWRFAAFSDDDKQEKQQRLISYDVMTRSLH